MSILEFFRDFKSSFHYRKWIKSAEKALEEDGVDGLLETVDETYFEIVAGMAEDERFIVLNDLIKAVAQEEQSHKLRELLTDATFNSCLQSLVPEKVAALITEGVDECVKLSAPYTISKVMTHSKMFKTLRSIPEQEEAVLGYAISSIAKFEGYSAKPAITELLEEIYYTPYENTGVVTRDVSGEAPAKVMKAGITALAEKGSVEIVGLLQSYEFNHSVQAFPANEGSEILNHAIDQLSKRPSNKKNSASIRRVMLNGFFNGSIRAIKEQDVQKARDVLKNALDAFESLGGDELFWGHETQENDLVSTIVSLGMEDQVDMSKTISSLNKIKENFNNSKTGRSSSSPEFKP